jgi:3-hydroxyisobutyrate dehydrogenase
MSAVGSETRVGWIGAGRMGTEMCLRLLGAGATVEVWNRTPEKAQSLVDAGATLVERPVDLSGCDVVFTMVAAGPQLELVTIGEGGVLTGESAPPVLVDCSTVSAEASERVRQAGAEKGTELVAAPISGSPKAVHAGRAAFAVSGPRAAAEAVEPLLNEIAQSVTYIGEGDAARLVKIAHNVFLGVVAQSLAEITVLVQSGGIRRADFLEFLGGSVMGSTFTRYKAPAYVNRNYKVTFTPELLRKDLDLGLDAAREEGVEMPLATLTRQIVDEMMNGEYGDQDFSALLEIAAANSGLELEDEDVEVSDGLDDPEAAARVAAR